MTDARATGGALKEKVEAEAARAEAEEPETEAPVDDDPDQDEGAEAEDGAEQATPEPEQRKRGQKSVQEQFETAMQAFGKKLRAIFEVESLTPAPHPGVVGFMLPGFAEPRTHDNYKQCATCNGIGRVLTSANTGDESKDWHVCPDTRCKGRGYWEKQTAVQPAPPTGPLSVEAAPAGNGEFGEAPAWLGDPSLSPQA